MTCTMDVVVVESPTKAKTINKYLGDGYQVLSSYGHVRDLRTGDVTTARDGDGVVIQTCVSAAAGDCDIDL